MQFDISRTSSGLEILNDYLSTRSYITGFQPSQNDLKMIQALPEDDKTINTQYLPHIKRWSSHIKSLSAGERNAFPSSNAVINIAGQEIGEVIYTLCTYISEFESEAIFL